MTRINTVPHAPTGPAATHKKPGKHPPAKPFDALLDGVGKVDGQRHAPKTEPRSPKPPPSGLSVPAFTPGSPVTSCPRGSDLPITETDARLMRLDVISHIAGTLVQALLYPEGAIAAEYLSELPTVAHAVPGTAKVTGPVPAFRGNVGLTQTNAASIDHEPLASERSVHTPGSQGIDSTQHDAAGEATTRGNESAEVAPLPAHPILDNRFPERNFHLAIQDGDYHVWLRDYRLSDSERQQLVERLLQGLQHSGRAVHRITINGQLAWSAGRSR